MITQARLKELLRYDPETGAFTRVVYRGGRKTAQAGAVNHHGYRVISVDGRRYQAARLAVLYMTGRFPPEQVDHQNGVSDDDRWCNLRLASQAENLRNRSLQRNNKAGFKGVRWCSQKNGWVAQINYDKRVYYLGTHACPEQAHLAYVEATARLHGDFARVR